MSELMTHRNFALKIVEDNHRALDLVKGPDSTFRMSEQSRRAVDLVSGANSLFRTLEKNRKLLDTITALHEFAAAIGMHDTLAAISSRPYFSTMIGMAAMPCPAWIETVEGLRSAIGNSLYAQAIAELNEAADLVEEGDPESWWFERLPIGAEFALLIILLEVIEQVSEFGQDVSGVHLPPAYTSGVKVLFALATAILALVDAPASAVAKDEER